jgi:predicted TIM-barrel fold metal-dependent hydrolase
VLFARPPKPEEYEKRRAGVQAHNRWLVDWCSRFPERRAGVGQVFLNDVDDAIEDLTFIKENGLRGGVLLPNPPPDCAWVPQLFDPVLDRFWAACQDLDVPVTIHGGTGNPDYSAAGRSAMLLYINEVSYFSQRPLTHLIMSGVFERFPRLKLVLTETGCAWVVPILKRLDAVVRNIQSTGETGEIKYDKDTLVPKLPSEYFRQNVWLGVSFPGADDMEVLDQVGADKFMWGSDYPHDEGTFPHTREHLRARFAGLDPDLVHRLVAGNAAELYDFDLAALQPLADRVGPTVAEVAEPYDGDDVAGPIRERLSDDMDAKAL